MQEAPLSPVEIRQVVQVVITLKLNIPDLCLYDSEGRVVFVLEVCIILSVCVDYALFYLHILLLSIPPYFATFTQVKINKHDVQQAQNQLKLAVLGNWRKGVPVMAGGICLAGFVSNSRETLAIGLNSSFSLITCSLPSTYTH